MLEDEPTVLEIARVVLGVVRFVVEVELTVARFVLEDEIARVVLGVVRPLLECARVVFEDTCVVVAVLDVGILVGVTATPAKCITIFRRRCRVNRI